jgi:hypothetical protein
MFAKGEKRTNAQKGNWAHLPHFWYNKSFSPYLLSALGMTVKNEEAGGRCTLIWSSWKFEFVRL